MYDKTIGKGALLFLVLLTYNFNIDVKVLQNVINFSNFVCFCLYKQLLQIEYKVLNCQVRNLQGI